MITFLPYPDFTLSAQALDKRRLGKQRIEALQILKTLLDPTSSKSKQNHPATRMWSGSKYFLAAYGLACCAEFKRRGYTDNCGQIFDEFLRLGSHESGQKIPWWFGIEELHSSHRATLLWKDPQYYRQVANWEEPARYGYFWTIQEDPGSNGSFLPYVSGETLGSKTLQEESLGFITRRDPHAIYPGATKRLHSGQEVWITIL